MTKNGKQDADVSCSIARNGENFPLESIDDKKGLGVIIDIYVQFENHINEMVKKSKYDCWCY
jgi:hypothetical protein